jgi:hypothetical protein
LHIWGIEPVPGQRSTGLDADANDSARWPAAGPWWINQRRGASNGAGLSPAFNPTVLPSNWPRQFEASPHLTHEIVCRLMFAAELIWINSQRTALRAPHATCCPTAHDIMSFNAKCKRLYLAGRAFVRRNFAVTLVVMVILLQAIIWLAVRALEDTQTFYRCGDHDYPCGVKIQPEPKI